MADTRDLKSRDSKGSCGFESRLGQFDNQKLIATREPVLPLIASISTHASVEIVSREKIHEL